MRRQLLNLLVTAGVIAVVVVMIWSSKAGRAVRGVATVRVVNETGQEVHDVAVTIVVRGRESQRRWETIERGESAAAEVGEVECLVMGVSFQLRGRRYTPAQAGLVTRGETWVVRLMPDGTAQGFYDAE